MELNQRFTITGTSWWYHEKSVKTQIPFKCMQVPAKIAPALAACKSGPELGGNIHFFSSKID